MGRTTEPVDLLLLLYASDAAALEELARPIAARYKRGGVAELRRLDTEAIGDREHFGFRDGISQPVIAGLGHTGPAEHIVHAGEFVLGYPNEYGLLTDRPLVPAAADPGAVLPPDPATGEHDLGRNGTYLVFRQLRAGRRRVLGVRTRRAPDDGDPTALGRQDGGSLAERRPARRGARRATTRPSRPPTTSATPAIDPDGMRCPIGAHVRRSNPRDSLDPSPARPTRSPSTAATGCCAAAASTGRRPTSTACARAPRPPTGSTAACTSSAWARTSPASSSSSSGPGWETPSSPASTTTPTP